jgi:hypothetical protein
VQKAGIEHQRFDDVVVDNPRIDHPVDKQNGGFGFALLPEGKIAMMTSVLSPRIARGGFQIFFQALVSSADAGLSPSDGSWPRCANSRISFENTRTPKHPVFSCRISIFLIPFLFSKSNANLYDRAVLIRRLIKLPPKAFPNSRAHI